MAISKKLCGSYFGQVEKWGMVGDVERGVSTEWRLSGNRLLPTGFYLQIPGEEGFGSAQSWPVNWLRY